MIFTLEQRQQILDQLNFALIRNAAIQEYAADYYDRDLGVGKQFTPPLHDEQDIWNRLNDIEQQSAYKVQAVQTVLEKLLTTETELEDEMGGNYALAEAGDLKWDIHTKTSGLERKRDTLVDRLRYFLKLPMSPPEGLGGTLGRS